MTSRIIAIELRETGIFIFGTDRKSTMGVSTTSTLGRVCE
jgi:hypothetical protein